MIPPMRSLGAEIWAVEDLPARAGMSATWRLSSGTVAGPAIYLRGVEERDAELMRNAGLRDVELKWLENGVQMTFGSAAGRGILRAQWAAVHEPAAHLYDALPLAELDPAGRRFWRWVFRLVQLPGGRHLLGLAARRARSRTRA